MSRTSLLENSEVELRREASPIFSSCSCVRTRGRATELRRSGRTHRRSGRSGRTEVRYHRESELRDAQPSQQASQKHQRGRGLCCGRWYAAGFGGAAARDPSTGTNDRGRSCPTFVRTPQPNVDSASFCSAARMKQRARRQRQCAVNGRNFELPASNARCSTPSTKKPCQALFSAFGLRSPTFCWPHLVSRKANSGLPSITVVSAVPCAFRSELLWTLLPVPSAAHHVGCSAAVSSGCIAYTPSHAGFSRDTRRTLASSSARLREDAITPPDVDRGAWDESNNTRGEKSPHDFYVNCCVVRTANYFGTAGGNSK